MARQLSYRSMGIRPCGVIAQRRTFPYKMMWIKDDLHPNGVEADVTPKPGCTYTRATWPPRGRGRGEELYSPRRLEAKQRALKALTMWYQGATWEAIAQALGFADKSGPWKAVRRMIDRRDYDTWLRQEEKKYRWRSSKKGEQAG